MSGASLPRQGFPRAARLLNSRDYEWVFARPLRSRDRYFTVLYRRRGPECRARLGVVVSRKTERRAVGRNRLKRLVRESFRLHQASLAGIDLVVLAKPGAVAEQNMTLMKSLVGHWRAARYQRAQPRPERS